MIVSAFKCFFCAGKMFPSLKDAKKTTSFRLLYTRYAKKMLSPRTLYFLFMFVLSYQKIKFISATNIMSFSVNESIDEVMSYKLLSCLIHF